MRINLYKKRAVTVEQGNTERRAVITTVILIFLSPVFVLQFLENDESFTGIPYSNLKYICEMKKICGSYGQSRSICSTAGIINGCIKLKMGDANYSKISVCSKEGSFTDPSAGKISDFQCFKASFDL